MYSPASITVLTLLAHLTRITQVKLHPARFYVINLELVTSDKGTVRCTISNLKDKARTPPPPLDQQLPRNPSLIFS